MKRRVAVVTADTLAPAMAGPAIRAFEIAREVSKVADVTLASTAVPRLESDMFPIIHVNDASLRALVARTDVLVFQGHIMQSHPWIEHSGCLVLADVYDPMHIEQLEQVKHDDLASRVEMTTGTIDALTRQLLRADFLVCASERQRDFWLGQLAGLGRINPATYDADPTLRSLIDVVPFGTANEPPVRTRPAIKGVVDGIGTDDKVVLWGGGIYNWFDPLSVIRAVARLATRHRDVRLFFLGVQHPNPNVPAMRMADDARHLAEELGLLGSHVFFNDEWVRYDDRANYLLDSDVGVSTHFESLETDFSFRTRILDYLWAGLPVVATEGDSFSALVEHHGLGAVVPVGDVDALVDALESVLYDENTRQRAVLSVKRVAPSFRWRSVLAPIVRFCAEGNRAPDLAQGTVLAATQEVASLRHRIASMEASFSWRATLPLRVVLDRLRSWRR